MENQLPPHFPSRPFTSDLVASHKSIYNGVFRSPSNHPHLPPLAPRLDDYSEIFHSSRSSSSSAAAAIPFLHLPTTGDATNDVHLDYSDVFGDIEALASFQDMFGSGFVYDDSPDDQWSPAQSDSLFDDLDNKRLSDADIQISLESVGASFNKSSPRKAHPIHTRYESSFSWDGEDEHFSMHLITHHDIKHNEESRLTNSCSSTPLRNAGSDSHVSEFNPMEKQEDSPCDEPFITVFDINLRTKPSSLPPPSRPPPGLAVKVDNSVVVEEDNSEFVDGWRNEDENVELEHESDKEYIDDIRTRCSADKRSHCLDESIGCVAWKEGTASYIEVTENNINGPSFSMVEDHEILMQHMPQDSSRCDAEVNNPPAMSEVSFDWDGKHRREKLGSRNDSSTIVYDFQQLGETENLCMGNNEILKGLQKSVTDMHNAEAKLTFRTFSKSADIKERFLDALAEENSTRKRKQAMMRAERWRKLEDVEREVSPERVQRGRESEEVENKLEASKKKGSDVILENNSNDLGVERGDELLMVGGKKILNGGDENDRERMIHGSGLGYRTVANRTSDEEESSEAKKTSNLSGDVDVGIQRKQSGHGEATNPIDRTEHDKEYKTELIGNNVTKRDQVRTFFYGQSELQEEIGSEFFVKHGNDQKKELNGSSFSSEGYEELKIEPNCIIYEAATTKVDNISDKEKAPNKEEASCEVPNQECSQFKDGLANISRTSTRDDEAKFVNKKDDIKDISTHSQEIRNSTMYGNKVEDAPFKSQHIDNALYTIKPAGSQRVQTRERNIKENFDAKDQKGWERMKRDTELENDHIRRLEEEREREREREKDRMSVDKVALQAHERSNAEARRRAERAAVERTSAESRLRTMAGIWERLEKSSAETRLKTERAVHERTWQRVAEKSGAVFKSDDTKRNSSTTDHLSESSLNSSDVQHSYSSTLFGAQGESPQRCKARLERYRRTTERAASALAEKNRRDLLAQREKEERNRVAEVLDPEIKRWSNGKEGNLRALLSTLQYILGQDSGWQPIPLTEIITSAAVKRSYRKATLCVHPDKLQQRGATIQQKYICEKVFDLLKEAWNKFNSEEL